MIPLTLWYSHDQADGDVARSHAELDAILDRVAALAGPEWPTLAEVTQTDQPHGPLMYVGFHLDLGALYMTSDADPGPYYTKGKGSPEGEPMRYMYTASDCVVPPNGEVSAALVRQATHEFADTGQRPTCVEWQTWRRFASGASS